LIDIYPGKLDREPILLSTGEMKRLLGVEFSLDQMVGALTSLGFDCQQAGSASEISVTPPYWRSDINLTVDLVEEVARITGYDKIPATLLSQSLPRQNPEPIIDLKRRVGRNLVGYGFQEIITYALTSLKMLDKLLPEPHPLEPMPLKVTNPMNVDQEYLRPNLRVGLLAALAASRKYEDEGIRLFELGKVYWPRQKDLPDEPEVLCGILSGSGFEKSWYGGDESLDFYDAKGVVEGLLSQLGVEGSFEESSDEGLHPDKQAAIVIGGDKLGIVGELHPKVAEVFEISGAVHLLEINLTALLPFTIGHKMFQPLSRFPAVARDMALVVDSGITHRRVRDFVEGFPLVKQVAIFDVYSGEQVPSGKKSLAYRITFQSPTHTLTDNEVNKIQQQILDKLSQELGAALRA